jgi:AcrR family transcriptional regulator
MGTKERQDRERQAVTASILSAARDLFIAEGYQSVSIRKIAERIEYSPAAIYSYYASKDDIFLALAAEGFHLLDAKVHAAMTTDDPLENVRGCWWAFYEFSQEQPAYFQLMFVDRSVPRITAAVGRLRVPATDARKRGHLRSRKRSTRARFRKRSARTRRCTCCGPR